MRRAVAWSKIDDPTVLRLVIDAVDDQEERTTALEQLLTRSMERVDARLGKILWVMIGILVTLTAGALLFAATGAHP